MESLLYYGEGFSSGWNIAKANSAELTSFDEESVDTFKTLCFEAEQISREFSPFEFLAKEINDLEYPSDAWDSYDAGIYEGINAFINQHINNKE